MRFQKPKGQRIHRYFIWVTAKPGLWWVPSIRKWKYSNEIKDVDCQSCYPCRTVKAFKRHIRKHPEIKGRATLVSRYSGYDVYG